MEILDYQRCKNREGIFSQSDLAPKSNISRVMIGKYKREETVPSIEVAKKIGQAFEVTLDYLGGGNTNASFDKRTVKRMQQIEGLSNDDSSHLTAIMDAFIKDANTRKEYNQ